MKNIFIILGTLALITASFYIGGRKYRKQIDHSNIALYESQQKVKQYEKDIAGMKRYVSETEVLFVSSEKAIKSLEEENKRIKELNVKNVRAIASLSSEINVLNKQLTTTLDTFIVVKTVVNEDCLVLPVELMFKDKFAWAEVRLDVDKQDIDFGISELTFNAVVGERRQGLFKKNLNVLTVDTPNPYVDTKEIKLVIVQEPKKWYQQGWIKYAIGFGAGYLIK